MLEEELVVDHADRRAPAVHRVLVAFDGSPGSWAALRYGLAVATTHNAVLTIAAVVHNPGLWIALPPFTCPYTRESLMRAEELELSRALAEARDEVPAHVSVSTVLLQGRAAQAIADLADGGRYDLVVMGPSRRGRLRRRLARCVPSAHVAECTAPALAAGG
jgi:nucleotide-binding universal stress UspA family protein